MHNLISKLLQIAGIDLKIDKHKISFLKSPQNRGVLRGCFGG